MSEEVGVRKARSAGSHNSISVTVPSTHTDHNGQHLPPVEVRSLSQERRVSPTMSGSEYHHKQSTQSRTYSPHSSGTIPPQGTPTKNILSQKEVKRILAARSIEKTWLSYRNRQMFKLLKHAVCAAEHSMSREILRKVAPREALLLSDKCMQPKVRFRFGGREFPPLIYFKIFQGQPVKYVTGKKMITANSEAAQDACDLMGNRKFLDQVIEDIVYHQAHKITDEVDVTTMKDYMQYASLLDETPAYKGGRDNSWRRLTSEVLPRQTIFCDVVEYLYSKNMSDELKQELPVLLSKPMTQEVQLEHIRIISSLRSPPPVIFTPSKLAAQVQMSGSQLSGRRSKQARQRAVKMRRMYESAKGEKVDGIATPRGDDEITSQDHDFRQDFNTKTDFLERENINRTEEENWEDEAHKLYEWTQELSFDDIQATPRLSTGHSLYT